MAGQALPHGQRLAVRPVHVLQHNDRAATSRQPAHNPQHRLGQHNRRRRHRRKGRTDRPVRHQGPQRGTVRRKDRVIRQPAVTRPIQQRLAKRPQRRDPICPRRTADQHDLPPPACSRGCLSDQPGLASARLACDDDAGTATASRPAKDLGQRGQLHIPADKDETSRAPNCRLHPARKAHAAHGPQRTNGINRRAGPAVPSARWPRYSRGNAASPADIANRGARIQTFRTHGNRQPTTCRLRRSAKFLVSVRRYRQAARRASTPAAGGWSGRLPSRRRRRWSTGSGR